MTSVNKKRGLGRGLDALFQDEEAVHYNEEVSEGSVQKTLSVGQLVPGKFQPRRRFVSDAIDQLAESIKIHGVLQPLLVREIDGGQFEIIAGERRWRAAQQAQLHDVPVVIQDLNDEQALEIGLIENLQRQDLTALEEAEGYQRLINDFGYTQEQLAQQLGKSRSHVANILRLLKLPVSVQELVQDEKLSAGHARALVTSKNPEELAKLVVKKGLSVRETEKLATGVVVKTAPVSKAVPKKDVDTLALEQSVERSLGMSVQINAKPKGASGQLVISYKDLDQLDSLLGRLA